MQLSLTEIFVFTNSTHLSRNFIEGERLINAGHVIFCGKLQVEKSKSTKFIAFCLQTSNMRDNPHEINGIITASGKIEDVLCSCKAGLSKKCKHTVAVFLHLSRINVDELDVVSSTDKKCLWKVPHAKSLEKYVPGPLDAHNCFQEKFSKEYSVTISQENRKKIDELLVVQNPDSALYKHMCGRHEPIIVEENNNSVEATYEDIENVLKIQPSECMLKLSTQEPMEPAKECCALLLNSLVGDTSSICKNTIKNRALWKKERQFRITGSRCYALFTYSKNKKANWESKSKNYFFPKSFAKTVAMKHGIQSEPLARKAYESSIGLKVIECGLVVSAENPWLGYSPDGVVLNENGEYTLIEIKCPLAGKTKKIEEVVKSIKYLTEDLHLKEKNSYYAQIQLGMAVLNIPKTDFIIYAPLDDSFLLIEVEFNEQYATNMLSTLKEVYYNKMLHYVCTDNEDK